MANAGLFGFLWHAIADFIYVFITSALLGVAAALLSAFVS